MSKKKLKKRYYDISLVVWWVAKQYGGKDLWDRPVLACSGGVKE